MLLTCPECHTQYSLDPTRVGPKGQMVRCSRCGHLWDFHAEDADDAERTSVPLADEDTAGNVWDIDMAEQAPATDTLSDFDDQQDTGDITIDFSADDLPPNALVTQDDHDIDMSVSPDMEEQAPPVFVHKDIHVDPPQPDFLDHQPFGLTPNQFGSVAFALLLCVTISGLLVAKGVIVNHFKPALAFYNMMGIHMPSPGEGMRLSDISARFTDGDNGRILSVEAKLGNISDEMRHYPSLKVEAKSMYGAVLKDWAFHPDKTELQPEEIIPVKFAFEKVPEDAKNIEISAIPPKS